ncbi:hypothetical protein KAFR_0E02240 [Kazachstania africana CBS 2517]|uniref:Cdc23 domain-containing protein n=1 Tax=Kazachstania africana (strain ATCC 22294 / BCRC 22015 / CBS 2517 / CECT 1963 / NBRC 1671 / NRRL Y-8276) TaxID=1071382 RepID=H2AVH7_KAZAF|nr:hypothetical protein KAFR_0E02240 [Kazachstania africana CBS 2517]CCF58377.1 hypothetical protein KAFR_0E02240 [Kazachstania africana CBS 2517]
MMVQDNLIDIIHDTKSSLRRSVLELSQWKLHKSAKWSAEALQGMADQQVPRYVVDPDESPIRDDSVKSRMNYELPQVNAGMSEQEYDLYLLASSLFDSKEFDRCSYFLKDVVEPRLKFLKLYCSYLSWDKKTIESTETMLMVGESSRIQSPDNDSNEDNINNPVFSENKNKSDVQISEDGQQTSVTILLNELKEYIEQHAFNEQIDGLGLALLYYLKGVLLSRQGNKSHAITAFLKSLSFYSFNWTCWVELLDCVSRPDESLILTKHLAEKFELKESNNIFTQSSTENNIMIKFFKLALYQEIGGNIDEFLMNLEYLLSISPNFAYLKSQHALVYYNHMDYISSEKLFNQIIKSDPYRLEDLDVYSNILYVMQKHSKLAYLAQFVSQIDKFRAESCCIAANYYSSRQEHEKSIMYFRRALTLDKKSTGAWTLMGHEFVELKNSNAAIECYRRAIDIDERDFKAWYGLGQAYEVSDMHLYSLYYFQRACTIRPLDRRMWQALASCYAKMNNSKESIKCYQRALQLSNNVDQDIVLHYELAKQYEKLLDTESCRSNMLKCVELDRSMEGVITDEVVQATIWLANYEIKLKNYETAYNYAIGITNGTSLQIDSARYIARLCREKMK